jgi:hypothetical protein
MKMASVVREGFGLRTIVGPDRLMRNLREALRLAPGDEMMRVEAVLEVKVGVEMELAGMGVPLEVIGLRLLVAVGGHVKG